jgi:hypothetical protein
VDPGNVRAVSEAGVGDEVAAWFAKRIPDGWFAAPPKVSVDRDEILVRGEVAPAGDVPAAVCIERFRELTRDARTLIARDAENLFGRKVSWGASCGDTRRLFSNLSVPVMTRLRMPEREVLDTLVDASVARSRSEALAWCVRMVGANEGDWIDQLREALVHVEKVRTEGPRSKLPDG